MNHDSTGDQLKIGKEKIPAICEKDQVWYPYDFMKEADESTLMTVETEEERRKRKSILDALDKMPKRKRRRR